MKTRLLSMMFMLLCTASVVQAATEVTVDSIKYKIEGGTASVVGYVNGLKHADIKASVSDGRQNYPVTSIGNSAFESCTSLTSVTIFSSVTSIGENAFRYCSGLVSVTIPSSVTSIGEYAFLDCSGLTSVTIPEGVTLIGGFAFYGCSSLTFVTIPGSVISIGNQAFSFCSGLTSVIISEGVTLIGEAAFSSCSGLTSVIISEGVTLIGEAAFFDCSGLTSVTIPEGVTSISDNTFRGCKSLTSVIIPGSVTEIGERAFKYCSTLSDIICCAMIPPFITENTFDSYTATLHVPIGSKAAYKKAAYWRNFTNSLEEELAIGSMTLQPLITYADGILSLPDNNAPATVYVYTQDGKCVRTCQMAVGERTCDLSSLTPGIYLVRVKAGNETSCLKIVK